MKNVYWRTPSKSLADGYGYAGHTIVKHVRSSGLNILSPEDFEHVKGYRESRVYISIENGMYLDPYNNYSGSLLINNSLPDQYVYGGSYNVGFTYWETDTLPSRWLKQIDDVDEVWTTSKWVGDVFRNHFPNKIVNDFKLGIDTSIYNIYESCPQDKPFTFLHIGSPSTRKNTQMAVDAFTSLFYGDKNYKMIIKSMGPPDARHILSGMKIGSLYDVPQFEIIDYEMTEEELNALYERSHCLVYPTRGEGWGMIPFNAIGKGIPTICTNATSCTEYAEMSVPLDFKWSSSNTFGIYEGGRWADPCFDDLCDKMKYVVDSYKAVKNKTLESAKILHRDYNWEKVSLEYKDRICTILNQ